MIKVVGVDPEHIYEVTCTECASKLEYVLTDTKRGSGGDYSGDTWTYYYIDCPTCSSKVEV